MSVIGNAGGGKSTLARLVAEARDIPYVEIDRLLWRPDWQPVDTDSYEIAHDLAVSQPN